MPVYHFNMHDHIFPEGDELPDLEAVKREAVALAGALIREEGRNFGKSENWHMDVTDDAGHHLFSLALIVDIVPERTYKPGWPVLHP